MTASVPPDREAEQDGLRAGLDAAEALLAYLRSDAARRWDIRYFGLRYAYDAIVALAEPVRGAQQPDEKERTDGQ